MQTSVSTLLILVSAVLLACVVIDYAVVTVEQTLQTTNIPQIDQIRKLEHAISNQTNNVLNQTQPQLTNQTQPQLTNQTEPQP
jgi:ABC-type uncharacterized transport system YnjBCD permease subunit